MRFYEVPSKLFLKWADSFQLTITFLLFSNTPKLDCQLNKFYSLFFLPVGPQLSLSSNLLRAEENQKVTIACKATGQPSPKITWSKVGGSLPGGRIHVQNETLKIFKVTKKNSGTYICKAQNILGSAIDTALLIVYTPLRFKVLPRQQVTPYFGSTLRLPCVAESILNTTITWSKNGFSVLPANTQVLHGGTLVIKNIRKSSEGSYTCRARNVLTKIEAKVKINAPITASCSEVKKYISSVSGNYEIDPDGEKGLASFTVYCDMTDKGGVGVTVISHDSERRTHVDGCEPGGCYSRDIHYTGASLSQLASLTRVSSQCEQFIKYECYDSVIFRWESAWWMSRDSAKMTYWGGASPSSGKCACGMTNASADSSYGCNCDRNEAVWSEDSGLLTDKAKLPVKQLRFGDVSGREEGYHTLGKLKCFGIA